MIASEYQQQAQLTATWDPDNLDYARRYIAIKMIGEVGEVCDLVGKELRANKQYREKLADEIGDVYWYIAAYLTIQGFAFDGLIHHAATDIRTFDDPYDWVIDAASAALGFSDNVMKEYRAVRYLRSLLALLDGLCLARNITRSQIFEANIAKITYRHDTNTVKEHN